MEGRAAPGVLIPSIYPPLGLNLLTAATFGGLLPENVNSLHLFFKRRGYLVERLRAPGLQVFRRCSSVISCLIMLAHSIKGRAVCTAPAVWLAVKLLG